MKTYAKKAFRFSLIAAGIAASTAVHAQSYPARPVTIMFPYPAGVPDLVLRAMAADIQKQKSFGQPVLIENRSGGNEVVAMQAVLNAAADGYTLGEASQNFSLNPAVQKMPYEQSAFIPVTRYASFPSAILARIDFPPKSVPEFIAYAKANPGKINVAAAGNYQVVSYVLLEQKAGIKITQIPFRGGDDAINSVVGGQVDITLTTVGATAGLVKQGKARLLAVTGLQRMPESPDTPALAESVPGLSVVYWQGLFAKSGTPRAVVDKWVASVADSLKAPEVVTAFQRVTYTAIYQGPEEMGAYIRDETETFGRAAKAAGIVPQ